MDDKKKRIEDMVKKAGRITGEVMSLSGDAFGLLALKLGNEPLAYKTIKSMRARSRDAEENVERFLQKNIEKVHVTFTESEISSDLKEKGEKFIEDLREGIKSLDVKKIREEIREKAGEVITKETRIYGDARHFYPDEDKVEGIVIDEITWKNEDPK